MSYPLYPLFLAWLAGWGLLLLARNGRDFAALWIIVGCAVFVGLRGEDAGSDTVQYAQAYQSIALGWLDFAELKSAFVRNGITAAEPGFILLSWLIRQSGAGFDLYLVLVVLISLLIMYRGYCLLSPYPLLSLLFYACSITLISLQANVIRQSLAVAFIVLALGWLRRGRSWRFAGVGALAGFFHISGFFVYLFCWLPRLTTRRWVYGAGFLLLVGVLLSGVIQAFGYRLLGGFLGAKFAKYFEVGLSGLITFKLLSFFLFYGFLLWYGRLRRQHGVADEVSFHLAVYCCFFYLQFLFAGDLVASERFGLYRFAWEPLLLGFLPLCFRQKQVVLLVLVALAVLYGGVVYQLSSVKYMLSAVW